MNRQEVERLERLAKDAEKHAKDAREQYGEQVLHDSKDFATRVATFAADFDNLLARHQLKIKKHSNPYQAWLLRVEDDESYSTPYGAEKDYRLLKTAQFYEKDGRISL